ncbi:MAG: DUF2442 domain-containing protein [Thermomonas sp.]|uniref:DUF2442 domain-containing protein n=1 Tax=Thermomonas sp. TaxID=1971895 RepID=UPI0039E5CFA9
MQAARRRAQALKAHVPQATDAAYNPNTGLVCIRLSNGIVIGLPAAQTLGLETASTENLSAIRISPSGYGIHFPKLDVDIYLPALMEGIFGTKAWMTERGRKGGQAKTKAKQAAARANGKLGGRPRKNADAEPKSNRRAA